jgi:hypothetical protein
MTASFHAGTVGWPMGKRRRAAAVQDAPRGTQTLEMRAASWSAPILWRFVRLALPGKLPHKGGVVISI